SSVASVRRSSCSPNASFATPNSSPPSSAWNGRIVTLRYGIPGRMLAPTGRSDDMGYSISSLDELGEGYGFRKMRRALGGAAFGVNAVVMEPHYDGFLHYHDLQDELYFVHSGRARVEVDGETHELGPGGLVHVESTTPRRISNAGDDDLVLLVVGGSGGYVERDGHLVNPEVDLPRRQAFGA